MRKKTLRANQATGNEHRVVPAGINLLAAMSGFRIVFVHSHFVSPVSLLYSSAYYKENFKKSFNLFLSEFKSMYIL